MHCMAEKAGMVDRFGHLNIDVITKKVTAGARAGAPIHNLVKKCAQNKGSPEETSLQLWICFVSNDIHYYQRL